MIKEFFRQVFLHLDWFLDYPTHLFIIIKSFCYYLWNGYSYEDVANIDRCILHKLYELIPLYQKRADAVPMPFSKEGWDRELIKLRKNIERLETEDLDCKQEMRIQDEITAFLFKYFWYLWY